MTENKQRKPLDSAIAQFVFFGTPQATLQEPMPEVEAPPARTLTHYQGYKPNAQAASSVTFPCR